MLVDNPKAVFARHELSGQTHEGVQMSKKKILLAGESWVSTATHIKGFDQFPTVTYHTGADELLKALKATDFDVTFMPAHEAQRGFPQTMEALSAYDAVVLSDIGANTLLLHPDTWIHSRRRRTACACCATMCAPAAGF